jgi:hypothetical protein
MQDSSSLGSSNWPGSSKKYWKNTFLANGVYKMAYGKNYLK